MPREGGAEREASRPAFRNTSIQKKEGVTINQRIQRKRMPCLSGRRAARRRPPRRARRRVGPRQAPAHREALSQHRANEKENSMPWVLEYPGPGYSSTQGQVLEYPGLGTRVPSPGYSSTWPWVLEYPGPGYSSTQGMEFSFSFARCWLKASRCAGAWRGPTRRRARRGGRLRAARRPLKQGILFLWIL